MYQKVGTTTTLNSVKPVKDKYELTKPAYESQLSELSALEEEIFHMRFYSFSVEFHGSTSIKCNSSGWDRNRYLTDGAGQSCQQGLKSKIEGKGECFKSHTNNCYSGPHDECALGNNPVIEGSGVIYSKSAIKKDQICCTLDCFSKTELYISLTDQPFVALALEHTSDYFSIMIAQ
ncbi:unnamed protein product [Parnassius apollo]|uniref:(apollo) hypothetical protein n=1 Tax=Parnassius apollo TaxID=110799 RepID=A0A8S3W1G0_PARAO|nr:unnamed protein product [Parnassius apollo]